MVKLTREDWETLRAIMQTLIGGIALLWWLYMVAEHGLHVDGDSMLDFLLILIGGGSGVTNIGRLRSR